MFNNIYLLSFHSLSQSNSLIPIRILALKQWSMTNLIFPLRNMLSSLLLFCMEDLNILEVSLGILFHRFLWKNLRFFSLTFFSPNFAVRVTASKVWRNASLWFTLCSSPWLLRAPGPAIEQPLAHFLNIHFFGFILDDPAYNPHSPCQWNTALHVCCWELFLLWKHVVTLTLVDTPVSVKLSIRWTLSWFVSLQESEPSRD